MEGNKTSQEETNRSYNKSCFVTYKQLYTMDQMREMGQKGRQEQPQETMDQMREMGQEGRQEQPQASWCCIV